MAEANWIRNAADVARGFYSLPVVKQLSLLVGLSVSVSLGFVVVLWSQSPDYQPLFANMSADAAAHVIETLEHANIKYKIERQSGSVLVSKDKIHQARIQLAKVGLPKDGSFGFEQLNKEQNFGASRFIETARYWHALEGELARTISSFTAVRKARVHLAVPKTSVFVNDTRHPSASVLIDLTSGMRLENEQVSAIVQMVASSVQGLDTKYVTVVDSKGRLLSGAENESLNMSNHELDYKATIEDHYAEHIEQILIPLVGQNKVRAQVTADIDFTRVEQTQEKFSPDGVVVRTEKILAEKTPTILTFGETEQDNPALPKTTKTKISNPTSKEQSTKNFEISKNISHTNVPVGKLERISVAVVVDDIVRRNPETGNMIRAKLTTDQLASMTELVKNAVGYNEKRGDTVSVINSTFVEPEEIPAMPAQAVWEQVWFWSVIKSAIAGGVILLIIFFILKPVMKSLVTRSTEQRPLLGSSDMQSNINHPGGIDSDPPTNILVEEANRLQQGQWSKIRKMAADDPQRIARVMRTWIGDE